MGWVACAVVGWTLCCLWLQQLWKRGEVEQALDQERLARRAADAEVAGLRAELVRLRLWSKRSLS